MKWLALLLAIAIGYCGISLDAALNAGADAGLCHAKNGGHGFRNASEGTPQALVEMVGTFFDATLQGGKKQP